MYHFIVNPNARTGLGIKVWNTLEQLLLMQKKEYQVYFTKHRFHATQIARKITSDTSVTPDTCILVALGGDGTINEVVNGIQDLSKVTLAYIPLGSSNDFARSIGLSTDPVEALLHILAFDSFREMNVGEITYGDHSRRFMVSSGMGFDAAVCHEVDFSRIKPLLNKIKLGKLSYVSIALKNLLFQTPSRLSVVIDGKQKDTFDKVYFAAAMNQRYEGGGFMFCPDAKSDDDKIDIIVAEGFSKWKVLFLLVLALSGKHAGYKGIHIYQCASADFISTKPLAVHTDGEPVLAQRIVHITTTPQKIRLLMS